MIDSGNGALLEYGRAQGYDARRVMRRLTFVGIALLTFLLGMSFLLPMLNPLGSREPSLRLRCASNMKQIGLGAIMYANDKGGLFPPDLETIVEVEDVSPSVLMCPMDSHDVPTGSTTRAILSAMRTKKLVSYIYVGKGLTLKASDDTVVLYEPLSDHGDEGMNVLFVDGHVEFLDASEAGVVLKQVRDGAWPIRFPLAVGAQGTQPATTPG